MQDTVIPQGKWVFDKEVTDVFQNMLERSIPGYHEMRNLMFEIGRSFVTEYSTITDIGCSNGLSIEPFVKAFSDGKIHFHLIDVSEPMLDACRERYHDLIESGMATVSKMDIVEDPQYHPSSLILSVLTLQFTPIEYRQQIISDIYNALHPKGAFIFIEKVLGTNTTMDNLMVNCYYDQKRKNNYTNEQILTKKKSLENVLTPVKASWNEDMLRAAGFRSVECFWRNLNFAAWVAIK